MTLGKALNPYMTIVTLNLQHISTASPFKRNLSILSLVVDPQWPPHYLVPHYSFRPICIRSLFKTREGYQAVGAHGGLQL